MLVALRGIITAECRTVDHPRGPPETLAQIRDRVRAHVMAKNHVTKP